MQKKHCYESISSVNKACVELQVQRERENHGTGKELHINQQHVLYIGITSAC